MSTWYLNPALTNFRREVNARWPNRDKASDGTIGDAAHQATNSDHNPDSDGSVDAWDMDVDGVDVQACINAALKHESIQYVIYNRRITSRTWGLGVWRDYDGRSPHTEHVHFNTRSSYENSKKPWFPEEDVLTNDDKPIISKAVHDTYIGNTGVTVAQVLDITRVKLPAIEKKVDDLAKVVTELKSQPVTVTVVVENPEVLNAVAVKVADLLAERLQA